MSTLSSLNTRSSYIEADKGPQKRRTQTEEEAIAAAQQKDEETNV